MPRRGSIGEAGFKKTFTHFLRLKVTHSVLGAIFDQVLSTQVLSLLYRRRHCEGCITTQGCSGGKGSDDIRDYGVGSSDVGKDLPRNQSVVCVLLLGERSHAHDRELSQHACLFRGHTLGSTIVVRSALHNGCFFLRFGGCLHGYSATNRRTILYCYSHIIISIITPTLQSGALNSAV